jgi:hypothetical protein
LLATCISLACDLSARADWHADAWPACAAGRTNLYTVGSVSNLLAYQVWATNGWDAITERAGVIFDDGIEELWQAASDAPDYELQGWSYTEYRANLTRYVLRNQTRVLAVQKTLVAELATRYWNTSAVATNAVDAWIAATATISTGNDCTNNTEDVSVEYEEPPWFEPATLAAAAEAPTNFFAILPWRWQAGFCDADYPLASNVLATVTNANTAAGGTGFPSGRTYWTMGDYGWDELRATIQQLRTSPIYLDQALGVDTDRSDTSTDWWWTNATSNVWANFYTGGGFGGGSSTSSWAAAKTSAESGNVTSLTRDSTPGWHSRGFKDWPNPGDWFADYEGAQNTLNVTNAAWLVTAGEAVLYDVREDWTNGQVTVSAHELQTATISGDTVSTGTFGGDARDTWAGDPGSSTWRRDSPENEGLCLKSSENRRRTAIALWLIRWDFEFQ